MARIGGMDYACAPAEAVGRRISDLTLDNGKPIEPDKKYRVAGWASMSEQNGKPVWDVLANYLRGEKTITLKRINRVIFKGVKDNPGVAE